MPTVEDIPAVKPDPIGTDADLQGYFSTYGIRSWTNHTESDDAGEEGEDLAADAYENALVLYQCKVFAGSFIAGKLSRMYQYSTLLDCPMMIEVWCVIVLRTLCFRRGNPPPASLELRYQEFVQRDGLLDQIVKGLVAITDENGDPLRVKNSSAPSWSNLKVDRIYSEKKIRVVSGNSDRTNSDLPRHMDRFPEVFG